MKQRRWIQILILFVLAIAGLHCFASNPYWVENYYARKFYPLVCGKLAAMTNALPFALFEWIVAAFILLLIALLVRWIRAWRRKEATLAGALGCYLLRAAVVLAGVYLWFLAGWGMNYYRVPLMEKSGLDKHRAELHHFSAASYWATDQIRQLHNAYDPGTVDEAARAALLGLDRVLARMGEEVDAWPITLKHPLWNYPFDASCTHGMIGPFTLELLLSKSLFPEEIPFIAAHEAAHLRGYTSEMEANLLAFEACLDSGHPLARFSAFFSNFGYLCRPLPHDELKALFALWPPSVIELDGRIEERKQQHSSMLFEGFRIAYHIYLRFHKVEGGIRNYSLVGGWIAWLHRQEAMEAELRLRGEPFEGSGE
jgi:hypothetical protein